MAATRTITFEDNEKENNRKSQVHHTLAVAHNGREGWTYFLSAFMAAAKTITFEGMENKITESPISTGCCT